MNDCNHEKAYSDKSVLPTGEIIAKWICRSCGQEGTELIEPGEKCQQESQKAEDDQTVS